MVGISKLEAYEILASNKANYIQRYLVVAADIPLAIQELHDHEPDIKRIQSVNLVTPNGGVVIG